jgi:hypothetical protein
MPVVVGQATPWNEGVCTLKSQKAPAGGSRTFTRRFKNLELTDLKEWPHRDPAHGRDTDRSTVMTRQSRSGGVASRRLAFSRAGTIFNAACSPS